MMKTILLLAFAVLVSGNPVINSNKNTLRELDAELVEAMKISPKKTEENYTIFLIELHMVGCEPEFFCQAEQELIKTVSVLSGDKFDHFRIDKKLMMCLNMYNKHHGQTCNPTDQAQDQIPLHDFLKNLLTCVRSERSIN